MGALASIQTGEKKKEEKPNMRLRKKILKRKSNVFLCLCTEFRMSKDPSVTDYGKVCGLPHSYEDSDGDDATSSDLITLGNCVFSQSFLM